MPGSYTWTIPPGVTSVFAFVIGGGGGGDWGTVYRTHSGGAGGGYAQGVISGLTPGNTITCTVGQGGLGRIPSLGQSAANGSASSFGSYLTGNGGEKGQTNMTNSDSATSDGGTASTSGATEVFTATGGHGGINGGSSNMCAFGFGGGASGSPFGTPKGFKYTGTSNTYRVGCTGGMGWHGSERKFRVPQNSSYAPSVVMGACGMGGHGHLQYFTNSNQGYANSNFEGPGGGPGLHGAKGGRGGISVSDPCYYIEQTQGASAAARYYQSRDGFAGPQPGALAEHGDSLDWWFPWEMDGGGGGSVVGQAAFASSYRAFALHAGHGGNGSGGGAVNAIGEKANSGITTSDWGTYHEWSSTGGNGGFGGGGGGGYSSHNNSYFHCIAGNGGVGGGGGSLAGNGTSCQLSCGYGGDGFVAIYY